MDTLWSMSTTVREAERIIGFLKTAIELDGEIWDKLNQERFQVLLIKIDNIWMTLIMHNRLINYQKNKFEY